MLTSTVSSMLQQTRLFDVSYAGLVSGNNRVLEAVAQLLAERCRMRAALIALGHVDAYEVEPLNVKDQLAAFVAGDTRIGSPEDPWRIMDANHQLIARFYIEADEHGRCCHRWSGDAAFLATMERLAKDNVH